MEHINVLKNKLNQFKIVQQAPNPNRWTDTAAENKYYQKIRNIETYRGNILLHSWAVNMIKGNRGSSHEKTTAMAFGFIEWNFY